MQKLIFAQTQLESSAKSSYKIILLRKEKSMREWIQ